ncbi:YheC/YheD family protein [Paenibacillus sp. GCM10023248]|uniref:YheC/YheD family protein n=1 Tax=unclassified Paenibacillus TaxID=185978 RepID=UPI00237837BD|nr:YheC/YheD family protein [Paenibacillus sp. MAHUQ-63]MDD9271199.1 YheC/YheD family protein [Paenibacillus sp. MAHUQ-63]
MSVSVKKVKYKMGKLGKHNFMKKYSHIAPLLPDTAAATKSNILRMIRKYDSLYLKPDEGTGGHGIYKITKTDHGFLLRGGTASRSFASFDDLYRSLQNFIYKTKYVVQQGIDLAKHNGRSFDIRVMVQRNRSRQLVTTGIIGRLAKPGKVVTNFHSGGTPLPIETLLQSHLSGDERIDFIKKIESLGREASMVLRESYRGKKAFGVDIAIDSTMKPWILEINTGPDMSIFNTLKDKTMYRRILRYAKL